MGAWAEGSFGNDDALDWVEEFSAAGVPAITDAFDTAPAPVLEAPDGSRIIAAAEVVAAAHGSPSPDLPEDARERVMAMRTEITKVPGLRQRAIQAVDRVVADSSELRQLWEEGDAEPWLVLVRDLRARLAN